MDSDMVGVWALYGLPSFDNRYANGEIILEDYEEEFLDRNPSSKQLLTLER